jgi:hypothetical protein
MTMKAYTLSESWERKKGRAKRRKGRYLEEEEGKERGKEGGREGGREDRRE